jgi:hypothetical protein
MKTLDGYGNRNNFLQSFPLCSMGCADEQDLLLRKAYGRMSNGLAKAL